MHATRNRVIAVIAAVIIAGCSDTPTEKYTEVTLNGKIQMVAGPLPEGVTHFRLYVLESLSGELAHPLAEIEDFESTGATFTHTFDFPLHKGEGLAVHAWLDTDGDGIFCTPDRRQDPSGLAWQTATPEGETDITIVLTENCRAANWFYPPAPE